MERNWTTFTVVWVCLSALVMGAFWHIWNIIGGEIPILESVTWITEGKNRTGEITPATVWNLPFHLSRSWDMLGAAMYAFVSLNLFRRTNESNWRDISVNLTFGLATGLAIGLFLGLFLGLAIGLIGVIIGLIFMILSPVCGLAFNLAFSFILGLWLGLIPGIAIWLIISSPLIAVAISRVILRSVRAKWNKAEWSGVRSLLTGNK